MCALVMFGAGRPEVRADGVEAAGSGQAAAETADLDGIRALVAQVAGEDAAAQEQAVRALVETGDAATLSRLELVLEEADRATRVAVKPIKTLLKNKLNLTSADEAVRRAAAGDLGASGRPVAIAWLEAAAAGEPQYWVRYAIEEGAALLRLSGDDPSARAVAAAKLGELKSQNEIGRAHV